MLGRATLCGLLGLFVAHAAEAALIEVRAEGIIFVTSNNAGKPGEVGVNDRWSGVWIYDSTKLTADLSSRDDRFLAIQNNPFYVKSEITVEGITFSLTNSNEDYLDIINELRFPIEDDEHRFETYTRRVDLATSDGIDVDNFQRVVLDDLFPFQPGFRLNARNPSLPPPATFEEEIGGDSIFQFKRFENFDGGAPELDWEMAGTVTSAMIRVLVAVPEPTTLAMLIASGLLVLGRRRRRLAR